MTSSCGILRFVPMVLLLCLAVVHPALGRKTEVPEWVTSRLTAAVDPISEDTDALLIYSNTRITYRNGEITYQEQRLYRIIKVDGLGYGRLSLDIVEDTKVTDIRGYRLDSSGSLVEELKKENIKRSAYNENFFDDCAQLTASFQSIETGDVVAFEYELEEEPFFKQAFIPFGNTIDICRKSVTVPSGARCVILNDPGTSIQINGDEYSVTNRPAIKIEDNSPPLRESVPYLAVLFEQDAARTWVDYSRMVWEHTREIPRLSDASKKDLQHLLSIPNRGEFIRKTLNYVARSVRYVAIESGEGRFIPRSVDRVHTAKYGDCKDMTYYAVAILREGGVTAHPVLALTRRSGPVFPSVPSNQFNHAIVAVELGADTRDLQNMEIDGRPVLIADVTDKHSELPLIGDHLENTSILPLTETGSPLLTIPVSTAEKNLKKYDVTIAFSRDRSAAVTLVETRFGHYAASERAFRESLGKRDENEVYRNWLQNMVPGAVMTGFTVMDSAGPGDQIAAGNTPPGTGGRVRTEIQFTARNLGTDVNDRIYYIPNVVEAVRKGYRQRSRETDLLLSYLSSRRINISIRIDPAFRIDAVPENASLDTDFFTASRETGRDGQTVTYVIRFAWKVSRIPSDRYLEFRNAYRDYLKLAKAPVTLAPAQ